MVSNISKTKFCAAFLFCFLQSITFGYVYVRIKHSNGVYCPSSGHFGGGDGVMKTQNCPSRSGQSEIHAKYNIENSCDSKSPIEEWKLCTNGNWFELSFVLLVETLNNERVNCLGPQIAKLVVHGTISTQQMCHSSEHCILLVTAVARIQLIKEWTSHSHTIGCAKIPQILMFQLLHIIPFQQVQLPHQQPQFLPL